MTFTFDNIISRSDEVQSAYSIAKLVATQLHVVRRIKRLKPSFMNAVIAKGTTREIITTTNNLNNTSLKNAITGSCTILCNI